MPRIIQLSTQKWDRAPTPKTHLRQASWEGLTLGRDLSLRPSASVVAFVFPVVPWAEGLKFCQASSSTIATTKDIL